MSLIVTHLLWLTHSTGFVWCLREWQSFVCAYQSFLFFFFVYILLLFLIRIKFVWIWECEAWFSLQCIVPSDRKRDPQLRMYRNHHSCSTSKMNAIIAHSCAAGAVTVAESELSANEFVWSNEHFMKTNEDEEEGKRRKTATTISTNESQQTYSLRFYFTIMLDWIASISLQNNKKNYISKSRQWELDIWRVR